MNIITKICKEENISNTEMKLCLCCQYPEYYVYTIDILINELMEFKEFLGEKSK